MQGVLTILSGGTNDLQVRITGRTRNRKIAFLMKGPCFWGVAIWSVAGAMMENICFPTRHLQTKMDGRKREASPRLIEKSFRLLQVCLATVGFGPFCSFWPSGKHNRAWKALRKRLSGQRRA